MTIYIYILDDIWSGDQTFDFEVNSPTTNDRVQQARHQLQKSEKKKKG